LDRRPPGQHGAILGRTWPEPTSASTLSLLGPVETPEIREMFARLGDEGRSRRFAHIPKGRFATLEEIAGAAAFLASADAGYLTADELPVIGGIGNAYTIPG
jgi:NAD(P)-dependent dehydrogenase (short-subunit alcohol dehydrogenase family)